MTEIIGKFTMLLINGIDDANDEYVRRRIDKCRRMGSGTPSVVLLGLALPVARTRSLTIIHLYGNGNWA